MHSQQVAQTARFSASPGLHEMYSEFHSMFVSLTIFRYIPNNGKDFH